MTGAAAPTPLKNVDPSTPSARLAPCANVDIHIDFVDTEPATESAPLDIEVD